MHSEELFLALFLVMFSLVYASPFYFVGGVCFQNTLYIFLGVYIVLSSLCGGGR